MRVRVSAPPWQSSIDNYIYRSKKSEHELSLNLAVHPWIEESPKDKYNCTISDEHNPKPTTQELLRELSGTIGLSMNSSATRAAIRLSRREVCAYMKITNLSARGLFLAMG